MKKMKSFFVMVALLVVFSFLIAGCGSGGGESAAVGGAGNIPDFTDYYNFKMQQFAANPPEEGQPCYAGDSNTEGLFAVAKESANPEARILAETFFNAGISGDTTIGLYNRMLFHLSYKPEIFAVNMGTNNIQFGIAHMTVSDHRRMLSLAKEGGFVKKYYIISILPRPSLFAGANATTKGINEELEALAKENEGWAEYIDIFPYFEGKDELYRDPWHLTKEGYELMAKLLSEKLGLLTPTV